MLLLQVVSIAVITIITIITNIVITAIITNYITLLIRQILSSSCLYFLQ
jgi:hypothetical protein